MAYKIPKLVGGTGATVSYGVEDITISAGTTVPTTFTEDSGTAVPSSNNINLLGSGSIATTGSGTTVTTSLTGLTNHNVLIGAGTSTITKVAPGASLTVLTSNGASSDPSFQAIPSQFTPNTTLNIFDDFTGTQNIVSGTSHILSSQFPWGVIDSAASFITMTATSSNAHPGLITLAAHAATASNGIILCNEAVSSATLLHTIILGGGAITLNWILNVTTLSTVTNRYIIRFGLGDPTQTTTADLTNGVYFEYSDNENSGDWIGKTASASSRSSANSAIAADTNFHNFQITINAGATSAGFFIDGVQIANSPLATNIPSVAISPCCYYVCTAGIVTVPPIIDLFYMTQTLTTAR